MQLSARGCVAGKSPASRYTAGRLVRLFIPVRLFSLCITPRFREQKTLSLILYNPVPQCQGEFQDFLCPCTLIL